MKSVIGVEAELMSWNERRLTGYCRIRCARGFSERKREKCYSHLEDSTFHDEAHNACRPSSRTQHYIRVKHRFCLTFNDAVTAGCYRQP
jgi:hypothetical protein